MAAENPYIEELNEAIDNAKKAILDQDYEASEAWQRQVEVLAPLVAVTSPAGAAAGGEPQVEVPVIEVPLGDDGFMSEGQRRRAEAQARALERQRR